MVKKIPGTMTYRQHNNYDTEAASNEAALQPHEIGESQTVQSQAQEADINYLMKQYGITGRMPENPRIPMYGDFTHITDYRSALEAVRKAHEGFMEIPADVRARFDNDPQQLLEFISNDRNYPEAERMGLLKPRQTSGEATGAGNTPPPATGVQTPPSGEAQAK